MKVDRSSEGSRREAENVKFKESDDSHSGNDYILLPQMHMKVEES